MVTDYLSNTPTKSSYIVFNNLKTLSDLLRYINLVLWQHVVCCV
jgi:hypothetical protein